MLQNCCFSARVGFYTHVNCQFINLLQSHSLKFITCYNKDQAGVAPASTRGLPCRLGRSSSTRGGENPKDIKNKPFKDWKEGQPTLYGRIDRCLRRLYREGRIKGRKHEKAMVYWYNPSFQIKYSTSPGGAIVMQQVEE